jgi:thymidylate synthase
VKAYNNLNSLLYFELKNISETGNFVESRGSNQKEVLFRSFSLDDPTDLQIAFPSRKFNVVYAITEWLWYLSKDSRVHNIGKLAKIWDMIKSSGGTVESNYGIYLFNNIPTKPSQWQWVISELTNDRDSRRATIPINEPHHKFMNNLDIPCTQYIQFFIRDNKLHLGVNMRSNDIIFGLCNDIFTFCMFQQLMLNELRQHYDSLELGTYYHYAGSLHLYDKHYEMADNIINDGKDGWLSGHIESFKIKFKLLKKVDYMYIKENKLYLPSEDMSKDEIKSFVNKNIKGKLFE